VTVLAAGAIGLFALALIFFLRVVIAILRGIRRDRVSRTSVRARRRSESQGRGW